MPLTQWVPIGIVMRANLFIIEWKTNQIEKLSNEIKYKAHKYWQPWNGSGTMNIIWVSECWICTIEWWTGRFEKWINEYQKFWVKEKKDNQCRANWRRKKKNKRREKRTNLRIYFMSKYILELIYLSIIQ